MPLIETGTGAQISKGGLWVMYEVCEVMKGK
jgi:hypothetical protein